MTRDRLHLLRAVAFPARRFKIAGVVAACLMVSGCNTGCELWGCPENITVKLSKPISSSWYAVELLVNGKPAGVPEPKRTVMCGSGEQCGVVPMSMLATVNGPLSVRVTTEAGSKVTEYASVPWEITYLDNCHTCRSANLTVDAP